MVNRGRGRATAAAALATLALLSPAGAAGTPARASDDPKRADVRASVERVLGALSEALPGASGYFAADLRSGETFARRADVPFPAASTIKIAVLLELFRRAEEGALDLDRPLAIDPAARVEGGGVLELWNAPYPALSARHLAALMMDVSDNYATNLLIDRLGLETIDRRLRGWGLRATRLRRRMMDVAAARAGRENVATPREMATLLETLARGGLLDAAHTAEALAIMKRNHGTPIKRGLPSGVESADKEGDLEGVRCGSGLIFVPAPGGARPFALSVMTAYLSDDAAGEAYISAVTRAVYGYFATLAASSDDGRRLLP